MITRGLFFYWLRWIVLLPICIGTGLLVSLIVETTLPYIVSESSVEKYQHALSPLITSFLSVILAQVIAPKYKVKTVKVICSIWIIAILMGLLITIPGIKIYGVQHEIIDGGIAIIMIIFGLVLGYYFTYKRRTHEDPILGIKPTSHLISVDEKIHQIKKIIEQNKDTDGDYWHHFGNGLIYEILDTLNEEEWEFLKKDLINFKDYEHSIFARAILWYNDKDAITIVDTFEIFFMEFVLLSDLDDADCLFQDFHLVEDIQNPSIELLEQIKNKVSILRNYDESTNDESTFLFAENTIDRLIHKHSSDKDPLKNKAGL